MEQPIRSSPPERQVIGERGPFNRQVRELR